MKNTVVQAILGGVLLLAVLAVITLLAWHKVLTGVQVFGIITTIVSVAAGVLSVLGGAAAVTRATTAMYAAQLPPPAQRPTAGRRTTRE